MAEPLVITIHVSDEEQEQLREIGEDFNLNPSDTTGLVMLIGFREVIRIYSEKEGEEVDQEYMDWLDERISDIVDRGLKDKSKSRKHGSLYIVKLRDRDVFKIGITKTDLKQRVASLQTGCPYQIVPYAEFYHEDCRAEEKEWHEALSTYQMEGEWFEIDRAVMDKLIVNRLIYDYVSRGKRNWIMEYWLPPHIEMLFAEEVRSLPPLSFYHPLADADENELAEMGEKLGWPLTNGVPGRQTNS